MLLAALRDGAVPAAVAPWYLSPDRYPKTVNAEIASRRFIQEVRKQHLDFSRRLQHGEGVVCTGDMQLVKIQVDSSRTLRYVCRDPGKHPAAVLEACAAGGAQSGRPPHLLDRGQGPPIALHRGGRLESWSGRKLGRPRRRWEDPGSGLPAKIGSLGSGTALRRSPRVCSGPPRECRRGLGVGAGWHGTGRENGCVIACFSPLYSCGHQPLVARASRGTAGVGRWGVLCFLRSRANALHLRARNLEKIVP